MRRTVLTVALALVASSTVAHAAQFLFNTNPFAGNDALTTPGRQIVGGEDFITFDPSQDVFLLDGGAFGVTNIQFISAEIPDIPSSGVNTIVSLTAPTPFAAGTAANLIADEIDTAGPGFFIYFNSGLDLPRLVFSTDLSDASADLKILFRMTNLAGNRAALGDFSAANFQVVPEPSTWLMMGTGILLTGIYRLRRK